MMGGALTPGGWDPELFARVRSLHLAARRLVSGLHTGSYLAVQRGFEAEFLGYRPYVPPHPLKDVDWRAFARNDRLVIRERRAERDLPCTLVFDASADIGSTREKWERAVEVTAAIACAVLGGGDPVGLRIIAGRTGGERGVPGGHGRGQLARILGSLAAVRPEGRADLAVAFQEIGDRARGRSLVGVISDFMEEPARWGPALGALTRRRADLRAIRIFDRGELELAGEEPTRLVSPESGRQFPVDPGAVRGPFREVVAEWITEVRGVFVAHRGMLWDLAGSDPTLPVLGAWLGGRPMVSG